jgi:hypothetical protein
MYECMLRPITRSAFTQRQMARFIVALALAAVVVDGHGAMVSPLSRNAVDSYAGVNTQRCSNITGDKCNNGQASFWYSQGCFIGCPECDNESGRRQVRRQEPNVLFLWAKHSF